MYFPAECNMNSFSATGVVPCEACEFGRYQPITGQRECQLCGPRAVDAFCPGNNEMFLDFLIPTGLLCKLEKQLNPPGQL